jgi:dihydrofolate synthase/folylpolyglutamate synthase
MTWRDALRWLETRVSYERAGACRRWRRMRTLDRIRRLLDVLGNPHRVDGRGRAAQGRTGGAASRGPVVVHIAGTKGKGSTAHLLAAALQSLGLRVGLYTSPHLASPCERIRVAGAPIPAHRLAAHLGRLRRALRAPALRRAQPTWFDLVTAAAFLEFRDRRVDAVVLEAGMGGRLDSTNVVRPDLAVVTNVDIDHTDVLGRTLGAIAREKAGIVKPGVPLLCGTLRPAARRVVVAAARKAGALAWYAGRELRLGRVCARGLDGLRLDARTPRRTWRGVRLALAGSHQADNALLALAALDRLEAAGRIRVDPDRVRRALAGVRVPARLEVRPGRPSLLLDAAHNPLSTRAVAGALRTGRRGRGRGRHVLLFAAAQDKDARSMLRSLAAVTEASVLVRVESPRMRTLPGLLALARDLWPEPPVAAYSPEEGLRLARALAGPAGRVIATGSFLLAGGVSHAADSEAGRARGKTD